VADDISIDLTGGGFTRGMLADLEQRMLLEAFSKHIDNVVHRINDGKEATVYLCRGTAEAPAAYLAAKVYRARRFRAFAGNDKYADVGRVRDRRLAKAIRGKSRTGRKVSARLWVDREWEVLNALHDAGASVPAPVDHAPDAVLMEFVGDEAGAAPMLTHVRLEREEAERAYEALLGDVSKLLECGLVHGDLSAYNVLYHEGRPRLIDLPQAVDLSGGVDGWALFYRDMENLAAYFARQGLKVDPLADALRLWQRYAV